MRHNAVANTAEDPQCGLKREQLVDRPLTDFFDESQPGQIERLLLASRETGFFHAQEGFSLLRDDGQRVPLNLSVSRIHVEPEPLGLLVARDISDRFAAEEKLRKRVFAIRNYTQTCQMGIEGVDQVRLDAISDYLSRIVGEADRCDAIIRELHSFSSRVDAEHSLLNINDLIRESRQLLSFELRQSHARLLLDLHDPLPVVRGSMVQIQQVILNLIRNSVYAISETDAPIGSIRVATRASEREVIVSVEDSGCGMDPEIMENAFRPFVTTRDQGLGMGLAISQRIVETHGGTIQIAESSPSGTTIEIRFPVVDSHVVHENR